MLCGDTITEYLNYNLEHAFDALYYKGPELILFSDSADAEKAYTYYNDPTEYPNGYGGTLWAVMEADETAYNLYKDGKVLFAEGGSGYLMGRAATQMVKLLLNGEAPRVSIQLATPADSGKTYLCNTVVLRNTIAVEEPEETETTEEQNSVMSAPMRIS